MIKDETIEILKSEITLLENKIKDIKNITKQNQELKKVKSILQKGNKYLSEINMIKLLKLLENYDIPNFENFKKEIRYVKYMYDYYYLHKEKIDFPQKAIADEKYDEIKKIINNIECISENDYQEEITNMCNRLKLVYNSLTKDIYTKPITEFDVINYIMRSPNLSKEQKTIFEKNINDYNEHINKIIDNHEMETIKENVNKEKIKSIDPYIKSFVEMLKVLNEDQIINNLPSSIMENCVYILNSIIDYVQYEISRNNDIINGSNGSNMISNIVKENKTLENIYNCVSKYLNKILLDQKLEEKIGSNIMINKIIYLNNYIFKDLKEVTEEEYESVNSSIYALINGDLSTNISKHRKLSNNTALKSVFEIKRSRVRLFYTPIGDNTYIILLLGQKNTNNDSVLIERAEKRIGEFRQLKRKGLIDIDAQIEKGLETTEEIINILEEKKRKM